ncbi:MAG: GNAT family N-acetyltransferase [Lachnospiraceae bacterium]|nr:MAG: GNAT family N-acetyltransferase [Lachnospiraceae bacterium]
MNYRIREIEKTEISLLDDFLYEAIFIPEGVTPPPKDIIKDEELQIYVKDFGKYKDDICFVAEVEGKVVGAVWLRVIDDYGHIDDDTPSLSISVYKGYRNLGIGKALIKNVLEELKKRGYKKTSLSVQKANYAFEIYKKAGYFVYEEREEDYIMVYDLKK